MILALRFEGVCLLISFSQVATAIVLIYLCDRWSIFEGVVVTLTLGEKKKYAFNFRARNLVKLVNRK
jgi:hypothetical protein